MVKSKKDLKNLPLRNGVGIVLLNQDNKIFVAKRIDNPSNYWQMPQGGIDPGENSHQAAIRELYEETGIQVPYMSHFANYSDPNRDSRHQVISVAYLAVHPSGKLRIRANSDVFDVNWFNVEDLPDLCFDHNKICSDGIEYSRLLIERKPSLAFAFYKCSTPIPGNPVPLINDRCPKLGSRSQELFGVAIATVLSLLGGAALSSRRPVSDGDGLGGGRPLAPPVSQVRKRPEVEPIDEQGL